MQIKKLYYCLCCAYPTLTSKPPGTYEICPICFWEDDEGMVFWSLRTPSNYVCLRQAQQNFAKIGACEEKYLLDVRKPGEKEIKDPNWQSLDSLAETYDLKLIEEITKAFDNVFGGPKALVEADEEDNGGGVCDIWKFEDYYNLNSWKQIPDRILSAFHEEFGFLCSSGIISVIAAFMVRDIKRTEGDFYLIRTLIHRRDEYLCELTDAQEIAIKNYLTYMDLVYKRISQNEYYW